MVPAEGSRRKGHGPRSHGCEIGSGVATSKPDCELYALGALEHAGEASGTELESERGCRLIAAFGEGEDGDRTGGGRPRPLLPAQPSMQNVSPNRSTRFGLCAPAAGRERKAIQ